MKKNREKKPFTPEDAIRQLRKKAIDRRDIGSFLSRLFFLVVFVWMLFGIFFRLIPMPNDDMKPALRSRDLQVVYCYPNEIWINDLVAFNVDGQSGTGRVVARPGDTIEITGDRQVLVNGASPYSGDIYYSTPAYDSGVEYPLTLGENDYFVLCDFREGGRDSRSFGPITREEMIGKVIAAMRRNNL